MKKVAKIFAVVLVCVLAVTSFVACVREGGAAPNADYDEAKKNLEDNGYAVLAANNGESDFSEAMTTLVNMGIKEEDVDRVIAASKQPDKEDDLGDNVIIAWFKTEEAAKEAYDMYKNAMDFSKDQLDESKSALESMKDGMSEAEYNEAVAQLKKIQKTLDSLSYNVSGKVFWTGTTAGINATKPAK